MKIILLDRVENLGVFGDKVNVKAGYARNLLVPYGRAVPATRENIKFFETRFAEIRAKQDNTLAIAKDRAEKVSKLGTVTIMSNVGKEGKLFGSVGNRDIANAVTAAGIKITKREVRLSDGVIRTIGKHEVDLQFHSEVSVKLVVDIIAK